MRRALVRGMGLIWLLLALLILPAGAAEVPKDLERALPREAESLLREGDFSTAEGFSAGLGSIAEWMARQAGTVVSQRLRGASAVLLAAVLCGAAEGFRQGAGSDKTPSLVTAAGALSITALTAGSLDTLLGLGARTIQELWDFSKVLLPALAAAAAAAGGVSSATVRQVATTVFAEALMGLINGLLMPMVYLYVGALAAGICLGEDRLEALAEGLKKLVTWILTGAVLAFTAYLSLVQIVSGAADGTAVRLAKSAISGVVPVVGGILAEASETVLAGAGLLRNTIGIFGMLAILAACAHPFLQLGVQYLLYKAAAFLAGTVGVPGLRKLIDGLGGAFGLVLGMTGSCALVLLVSVLGALAAVTP